MRRGVRGSVVASLALALVVSLAGAATAGGEVVYLTKFLDPVEDASEWGFPDGETAVTDDGYTAEFTEGALTVTLEDSPNVWLWPDGLDLPADQAVEVQVASSTGHESALLGVACRTDAPSLGYVFLVGTDGYYAIARYSGGKLKRLVNSNGKTSTDAVDPDGVNVVRGECVGKKPVKLTLTVNDEEVASFVDKKPPKRVGADAAIVMEVSRGETTTAELTGFAVYEQ